jgi:hypothetical protein
LNLRQRESDALSALDETKLLGICGRISTDLSLCPARFNQESTSLIEPNGLDVHARRGGEAADGK